MLEASDRVGGRILTEEPVPGVFLELGAQWIGDTHHRMIALADELGVALYPQFETGETSYEFGGVVQRETAFHAQHADDVAAVDVVLRQLDAMAATVSVAEPWAAPDADAWDRITVAQWYDSHGLSPVGRELLEICTVGILAVPTSEVSLLGLLVNVVTCGVTADLLSESEGGAQTQRFVGGTDQIPKRLADQLGERVVLNAPVQTIEYSAEAVTVTCRGGVVARGRRVIVALAPTLAGRILYDPPLSGQRDQLTQRMPQASAHKMFAVYDEPFWRADGLNGQLISDAGPARMTNDSCMPGRPGRHLAGVPRGRERPRRGPLGRRTPAGRVPRRAGSPLRAASGQARPDRRRRLGRQGMDPRLLQRQPRAVRLDPLRSGTRRACRADQLGRHRDRTRVERLHGGRGRCRRTCRPGSPRCAVTLTRRSSEST